MLRPFHLVLCALVLLSVGKAVAQMPSKEASSRAIAKHPQLGKVGSPFNVEFMRRLKVRADEQPRFLTDKDWPLKLADEVSQIIENYEARPEIEFKVLLIIKRHSDTCHPLFLPVRATMTEEDIQAARRCFEIHTPDLVHEATRGRVRFIPSVVVSDRPLRCLNPSRLDSAEYMSAELVNELSDISKPGQYDSAGYYFLHYDTASGYRAPRAGYGVGGYSAQEGIGIFAVSSAGRMNPRDEIFLHEWMHGLDGYYGGKNGVRLPKGALHGGSNYDAHYSQAKTWRPQDTFKGYMEWYRDILNCQVPESSGFSGHGSTAWRHGPLRDEGRTRGTKFPAADLPVTTYPEWVLEVMKGDLSHAELAASELPAAMKPGPITAGDQPWELESWARSAGTEAHYSAADGGTFTLECAQGDHSSIMHEASVLPSANYVFTAEIKTTRAEIAQQGGKEAVLIEAGDSRSAKNLAGSVEWTLLVLPFTTKPDQTTVKLRLRMGGPGSLAMGKAQFRNVTLRRMAYPAARLIRVPMPAKTG